MTNYSDPTDRYGREFPARRVPFQLHDKVRRYDYLDTGEVREVIDADRVVVYWPDDPRKRGGIFSLEWTEYLAHVGGDEG